MAGHAALALRGKEASATAQSLAAQPGLLVAPACSAAPSFAFTASRADTFFDMANKTANGAPWLLAASASTGSVGGLSRVDWISGEPFRWFPDLEVCRPSQ